MDYRILLTICVVFIIVQAVTAYISYLAGKLETGHTKTALSIAFKSNLIAVFFAVCCVVLLVHNHMVLGG